jgi:predicted transcriptional regulator
MILHKFDKIKESLISLINLSEIEAHCFLFLILNGKTPLDKISTALNLPLEMTSETLNGLVEKGLILELTGEYQSFHPKFSIVNAYRLHCQRTGIEFKKNTHIDKLASVLEKVHDSARTK